MSSVLIVDDDTNNVAFVTRVLEADGHYVQSRFNGAQGLRALTSGTLPDCVVLDVDMPVLDGPEMAHQMFLRDAGAEKIPIVLVSRRSDLPTLASRMGTPYLLSKGVPNYRSALLEVLDRALRERRAPKSA
jgi:CheY-like chemotaxis protein